jgi:hypothetical protein
MDIITTQDLQTLMTSQAGWCVSLFMPAHRAGRGTEQDRIRFRNLLSQVEKRLLDKGLRTPDVRKFLEPAERLSLDSDFWRRQSDGLAVFFTDTNLYAYRLPLPFAELVVVSERFHLKPLLPYFSSDGQFYILALSQNQVRLLKGSRHTVDEIEVENLPKSLAEALPFEQFEKQLQFHTGTTSSRTERAGVFHGHDPRDDDKDKILRWFHKIDAELSRLLAEERAPVVLAGVEYLFSLYEEANSYPHLLKEGVKGNPDELKPAELHEKAWPVVQPIFSQAQHKAASQYEKLVAAAAALLRGVKEALLAAHHGRVDTLFVALGRQVWGAFDPEADTVVIHDQAQPGDLDLLDLAAAETLLKGGAVFAVEPDQVPDQGPLAAIFRY